MAGWDAEDYPASVKTGRTNDEVKAGKSAALRAAATERRTSPRTSRWRARRAQPDFVPPMLATLTDGAFDDDDWLFEVKWDGYRVGVRHSPMARRASGRATESTPPPTSRTWRVRADWIDADQAIVDGEVVAFDEKGRPSFSRLQDRTGLRALEVATRRADPDAPKLSREEREAIPLAYMVFDLLYLDGRSLVDVPLEHRKRLLRRVLRQDGMVRYASHVIGDGSDFHAGRGGEGPGGRSWPSAARAPTSLAVGHATG